MWAEAEGETIVVECRDDGPGYPEEVLRGARRGIGLHIVEEIVAGTLRGTVTLANDGGGAARLRIKVEEPGRT